MSASDVCPWNKVALGEIFHIGSSKRVMQSDWRPEGVPFYRAREIVKLARDGFVENDLFISEKHFQSLCEGGGAPQCGDLMVSAVGTLGACYVVREEDRFYYKDASVLLLRPKADLYPQFVRYAFLSKELLSQVEAGEGATVGTFTIERARKAVIPFPPLDEQKRIVAALDQAFAALDHARASAATNLADAHELFQRTLSASFDEESAPDVEMRCLFDIGSSKRVLKAQWVTEGVPFYRGREVTALSRDGSVDNQLFITEEHFAELEERYGVPTAGDILVTAIGTIGNAYIVQDRDRFYFKDASVLWMKKCSSVSSDYVLAWLRSPRFFDQLDTGNGATVDTLTIQKLQSIKIPLPAREKQERIVARLDAMRAQFKKLQSTYAQQLDDIATLRQSLLQAAFSGQLS